MLELNLVDGLLCRQHPCPYAHGLGLASEQLDNIANLFALNLSCNTTELRQLLHLIGLLCRLQASGTSGVCAVLRNK